MRNEFAKWEIKTSMFSGRKSRVGNCCNFPAQLEELSSLGFGVLEFLEAHSSPLIGRTDSGDGLAAHGLLSTGLDGGLREISRGIARLAGARQTLSSHGW